MKFDVKYFNLYFYIYWLLVNTLSQTAFCNFLTFGNAQKNESFLLPFTHYFI